MKLFYRGVIINDKATIALANTPIQHERTKHMLCSVQIFLASFYVAGLFIFFLFISTLTLFTFQD